MYKSKLPEIFSWNDFFSYANTLSDNGKGDIFEYLTKLILITRPEYSSILKNVWRQRDNIPKNIREKLKLPTTDEGIDIIAETFQGEYWAIQCKFKGQNQSPTYKELSTFGNLANNYCKNIALALLVHTGNKGVKKKILLGENYTEIGLDFWLGLTNEDWVRIHKHLKGQSIRPKPKEPRPHQQKAIKAANKHFIKNKLKRGKLIMPCGTGKSLTAYWIANVLGAKSVIVVVPSLALIKQSLEDWTREFIAHKEEPRPHWLVICSDDSTAKLNKDEFVSDAHSMGIPTTTNIEVISAFLSNKHIGRKIIITTYQSSDKLAQASRNCKFSFDLAILDEAHKTVGIKSKTFATILSDKNISISKRIFMTATERVIRGSNEDIYSMDNEAIYGKLFYQLTFKDAIQSEPPIICDYKVLTISVTNDEIKQLIDKNKLLTDFDNNLEEQEAQSLASAIALRKATQKYGIKHAISFHRSISSANDFTNLHNTLNSGNLDKILISSSHISSKQSAGERARLLNDFAAEKLALLTNARCLTEGVDVPKIDCVLFADPKQSVVDIVQASGRALRPYPSKDYGYIMLPLIVPDGVDFDEFTDTTPFKDVAKIISALSMQDESIAEEFRLINTGKQKFVESKIIIEGNIPVGMNLDLSNFANKINAKIWERVGRVNYRPFMEARAFAQAQKFRNSQEWYDFCKSGMNPPDIPTVASKIYFDKGWKSWSDWLGTNRSSPKEDYLPFKEARLFVQKLEFKNRRSWKNYCKSGQRPSNIPASPNILYKENGWSGMGDFLGTFNKPNGERTYLSFEEARAFVHTLKLKTYPEWRKFTKTKEMPKDIPNSPIFYYKGKGWKDCGDWLGTDSIQMGIKGNRKYLPFEEAKAFVRTLNIQNLENWNEYSQSEKKPHNIPKEPQSYYRDKGWQGFNDWLGIVTIALHQNKNRQYEEARAYVHELHLKNVHEWIGYCKSGKKPKHIPSQPNISFFDKGWIGYGDWLGTGTSRSREFRQFNEARSFVQGLKLKGIKEWNQYCKSKERPVDIPSNPNIIYSDNGWKGYRDWLGNDSINMGITRSRKYLPFDKAREYIHTLNLTNKEDWNTYCQSENKPNNIPSNPGSAYYRKGWISYEDWLGLKSNLSCY